MRYAVDDELFHHGAAIYWQDGVCCVVEANLHRPLSPVPLTQWVLERHGQWVAVQPRVIAHEKFHTHFGKKYDRAAAFSKLNQRITGDWNGRTGPASEEKIFCLEFLALLAGLPDPYCMGMKPLLSSAPLLNFGS